MFVKNNFKSFFKLTHSQHLNRFRGNLFFTAYSTLITITLMTFSFNLEFYASKILPRLNNSTFTLPVYKINLDLPVAERYSEILTKYKNDIKALSYYSSMMPTGYLMSKISSKIIGNLHTYDKEWIDYIIAVRNNCEISLSQAIVISITYDMGCTTAIAQDQKGNILMGRNLDFGTYFINSHMNFEAHYYKEGKYLFKAVELAGFRGIINGIKENKYSVSLNLRSKGWNYSNLFRIFYHKYYTPNFYLYKVMVEANSFSEAVKLYSENIISAPVYYSIAGINKDEGIIISRDYNKVDAIEKLNVDKGKWFIVICNTDFDKEEPAEDFRRKPAEDKLKSIGQDKITFANFYENIMSQYPNNNLLTIYTTMQTAQNNGYFNTTVWLP